MTHSTNYVIGMDLSDRSAEFCGAERSTGSRWKRGKVQLTPRGLKKAFGGLAPSWFVIEIGTHARWVKSELEGMGHEVTVSDARKLRFIYSGHRKSDRLDAEALLDVALLRKNLLHPIELRGDDVHRDLIPLRLRDALVRARTLQINAVRGTLKAIGLGVVCQDTQAFVRKAREQLPLEALELVEPMLDSIERASEGIASYDGRLKELSETKYRETRVLRQIHGVGPVTALAFVLTLGAPERFHKSRDVGAYLGLVPGLRQSGLMATAQGISKAGNPLLRRLLVQCAHTVLRRDAPDTDLKRHGQAIASRNGKADKGAKRRAVVAVARKLSVLLFALWRTGEVYEPLRNAQAA